MIQVGIQIANGLAVGIADKEKKWTLLFVFIRAYPRYPRSIRFFSRDFGCGRQVVLVNRDSNCKSRQSVA
jgi:hypothetical protein